MLKTYTLMPEEFPPFICEINDPPKLLYMEGEYPPPDQKFLCVVGSRKYSSYGKDACEKLIAGLAGLPVAIVSGLALGIDGIAHRAALAAGLKTVAVPGSGLSRRVLYPSANRRLAEEILAAGGCLLSEFEPETRGAYWTFPQRNRIMAGLSHAVLIIEAERKSGTMITMKLAADYNRDVLALPGSIFSPTSEGPHYLIRNGATPITSPEDLREALGFRKDEAGQAAERFADCSDEELAILKILAEPMSRDALIQKSGKEAKEIGMLLTLLELKGHIRESLGEIRQS